MESFFPFIMTTAVLRIGLTTYNNDLSHEACAKMLSTHPLVEQFVLGWVVTSYKYIPVKHSMQKSEDPHHGRLIVGRAHDVNGIILWIEIGASEMTITTKSVFLLLQYRNVSTKYSTVSKDP